MDPSKDNTEDPNPASVDFIDFTSPDADSLWARVDFLGIVAAYSKATLLSVFAMMTGITLAMKRSYGNLIDESMNLWESVPEAIVSSFSNAQSEAVRIAGEHAITFGSLSLPAGTISAIAAVAVVTFVLFISVSGGED